MGRECVIKWCACKDKFFTSQVLRWWQPIALISAELKSNPAPKQNKANVIQGNRQWNTRKCPLEGINLHMLVGYLFLSNAVLCYRKPSKNFVIMPIYNTFTGCGALRRNSSLAL